MRVILFGATGMVGKAALIECLADDRVTSVVSVARRNAGVTHAKLREVLVNDFFDYAPISPELAGADACFFCLGVTSARKSEIEYTRLTYELTMAAAKALVEVSPAMSFCFVSGAGTDSTERGRVMWARVKGKTENALLALPFRSSYMLRPGFIQPMKGVRSSTPLYQTFYTITAPLTPLLRPLLPGLITTSERLGRALIELSSVGYPRRVLETRDINQVAARAAATASSR